MLLLIAVFIALISADCLPLGNNADTLALTTESTCASAVIGNVGIVGGVAKAQAVCTCIQSFAAAIQPNCDSNSLAVAGSCAAATILGTISAVNYDFGADCSTCANPPPSPTYPSACSVCYMKYVSCLTTGYFNLKSYPSISNILSLKTTCNCLGNFYSCINSCGSPLSQFVGNLCSVYNFCGCDGSLNVAGTTQVIAYLKSIGFSTFSADITLQSTGSVISIDCVTKTTANNAGLATDRFLCDINFASNSPDYASFHVWVTNYLGKEAQIAVGTFLQGPVVSLKRDSQEAMVSSTYTIVVASGSVLSATFSLVLVLGAMLVLLF